MDTRDPNPTLVRKHFFFRVLISTMLVILGFWTVYYNWPLRSVRTNGFVYSADEAHRFRLYPNAQYAYGMQSWLDQQPKMASEFFRQAVSLNALHIDAWLRLAETEAAMGHVEKASSILAFTTGMTDSVMRWKWPQMVLARELGMDARFHRHANYLLSHQMLKQDTLQLLHTHFDGDASAVIDVLETQHLGDYLEWLTRWGMTEESLTVWQALTASATPGKEIALRYAHFLLSHKRIHASTDIWQTYADTSGLTNPGFERKITGQGFDWRYWNEKSDQWNLKRVYSESAEGDYALRITFDGKENLSFHHLYQIVAANPLESYRLTYAWKTSGITTDQGPFVEIVGYDGQGLHQKGSMMTGTHGWREEAISFTMPAGCHAAVVRLRRRTSMRFDSKIRGRIWLDNFRLEKTGRPS